MSDRLRQLREQSGMTKAQAAALMGINPRAYSSYESGDTPLTRSVAGKMAEAFKTTVEDILPSAAPADPVAAAPVAPPPEAAVPVETEEVPELTEEERAEHIERIKKMLGGASLTDASDEPPADTTATPPPLPRPPPPVEELPEEDVIEEPPSAPVVESKREMPPEEDDEPFEYPDEVVLNPASGYERGNNHLLERIIDTIVPSPGTPVPAIGMIDSTGTPWADGVSVGPQDGALVKIPEGFAGKKLRAVEELVVRHDIMVNPEPIRARGGLYAHVYVNGYPINIKAGLVIAKV